MATQNISSGGQFPKPSYNSGYGSTGYDALNQSAQDYNKSGYPGVGQINSGVGQQSKGQNVSNQQLTGTGTDLNSSMYGKSHAALNKVNVSLIESVNCQLIILIVFTFNFSHMKSSLTILVLHLLVHLIYPVHKTLELPQHKHMVLNIYSFRRCQLLIII